LVQVVPHPIGQTGQLTIANGAASGLLDRDVIWKPRSGNVKKLVQCSSTSHGKSVVNTYMTLNFLCRAIF